MPGITVKSGKSGKSYEMPWTSSADPTDDQVDKFIQSQEIDSNPTPTTPVKPVNHMAGFPTFKRKSFKQRINDEATATSKLGVTKSPIPKFDLNDESLASESYPVRAGKDLWNNLISDSASPLAVASGAVIGKGTALARPYLSKLLPFLDTEVGKLPGFLSRSGGETAPVPPRTSQVDPGSTQPVEPMVSSPVNPNQTQSTGIVPVDNVSPGPEFNPIGTNEVPAIRKQFPDIPDPIQNVLDSQVKGSASTIKQGGQAKFTLPPELRGSKPRFNMGNKIYIPHFENDLDKAAYIIAQKVPSKSDAKFLKFFMDSTGMSEDAARLYGTKVKAQIKVGAAGAEPGDIKIPDMFSGYKGTKPLTRSQATNAAIVKDAVDTARPPSQKMTAKVKAVGPDEVHLLNPNDKTVTELANKGFQPTGEINPDGSLPMTRKVGDASKSSINISTDNKKFLDGLPEDSLKSFIERNSKNSGYDSPTGKSMLDYARNLLTDKTNNPAVSINSNLPKKPLATNLSVEDQANIESWYKFKKLHDSGKMTDEQMLQWAKVHNKVKALKPNGDLEIQPYRFETLPPEAPEFTTYALPNGEQVKLSTSATKGAPTTSFQMKGGNVVEATRVDSNNLVNDISPEHSPRYYELSTKEENGTLTGSELDELIRLKQDYTTNTKYTGSGSSQPVNSVGKLEGPQPVTPPDFKPPTFQKGGAGNGGNVPPSGLDTAPVGPSGPIKPKKSFGLVTQLGNNLKSATTGLDLSAPLNQGRALMHKKEFYKALPSMFKSLASEDGYNKVMSDISEHPNFEQATKDGLSITTLGDDLNTREEHIMGNMVEKIPGVGRAYRASNRAYTGFLDKLRFDTYNSMLDDAALWHKGRGTTGSESIGKDIADVVNVMTGRGKLGKFEGAAPLLNATFFSPRRLSSRIKLLTSPISYRNADPYVRKEAIKSLAALVTTQATLIGLASAAGMKHSFNPVNADFGKFKAGDNRIDTNAGVQQLVVLASRLASRKTQSSVTGKTNKLDTGKFGAPTSGEVISNFLTNKEAPLLSLVGELWTGKNFMGDKQGASETILRHTTPMLGQDAYDILSNDPKYAWLIAPATFGAGINTYKSKGTKIAGAKR